MQLELLWKFMQVDMQADRFENEMRQSPNRQKLLKHRNFLFEQQNNMKRIEGEISAMNDRMEAVSDEAQRLEGLVRAQSEALEAKPPEALSEIEKQAAQLQKLVDSLARYEQELAQMRKTAETRDRQQREIRVRAAKAKAEYDQVKQVYDVEFKRDSAQLAQYKADVERESKKVDAGLLKRYQNIKQHATPPMAVLVGDQCGGCYMSLPSVMLKQIRDGEAIVECDNCGRILYVPPEENNG